MDDRRLWLDDPPVWERDLDALVRPSLVAEPPAHVQQAILAAVLQAAVVPVRPVIAPAIPLPIPAVARPVPLAAYLLLAAVLVAYVAAVSWVQGLFGGAGWLTILLNQLLAVSQLVVGRLPSDQPLTLIWLLFQRAPWIAVLPLAWLLWERDRAAARAA